MTRDAADWVREHDDLELVDFTRDGYQTVIVAGSDEALGNFMQQFRYVWRGGFGPDGAKVLHRVDA